MKIRLGLTRKLVLAFLLMAALLLAVLAGALYWSFQRGFLDYLGRLELEALDPLAETLVAGYERFDGWDWIRDEGALWRELLVALRNGAQTPAANGADRARGQGRPPPPPPHHRPGPGFRDYPPPPFRAGAGPRHPPPPQGQTGARGWPPPGAPDPMHGGVGSEGVPPPAAGLPPPVPAAPPPAGEPQLIHRLTLLDADRDPLIGPRRPVANALLRPLKSADQTIGWLRLAPRPGLTDTLDLDFQRRQLHVIQGAAAAALVLALVLAIPLAAHLLGPIRTLTRNMVALTSGRFDTRTRVRRGDELGALASGFNRLAETLEQNETLRRRWIAEVSHELRTPLAVLTGELDAIVDGIRPWSTGAGASLHAELARLNKLVEDLHQLAVSDLGALSYRMEVLELEGLVESSIARHEARFAARGLKLESELAVPPATVLADANRLGQLLDNLLQNSRRYTDAGGTVRVRTSRREGFIHIDVEDSAPGVPDEALPRLFERLYRTEESRNRASGGAGLGLAIARNIVEAHGGQIKAKPSPLGGLWIEISLPFAAG